MDFFTDYPARGRERKRMEREKRDATLQRITLNLKERFGNNAVVRAVDLMEDAT